jgi:hypothetical protein
LDESVELTDSMDNGILIRSGDGSLIATSQQNYMFANGVWRSAGPIQRNSLDHSTFGNADPMYEATEVVHADGSHSVFIGGKYQYNGRVYNEYRLEIEDTDILDKVVNDVNEGINTTPRKPKVAHIMGNMVGNDSEDPSTYGKFLAPAFLKGLKGDGNLLFEALTPNGDGDALGSRGIAWAYHIPNKGFFGQDKEGAQHVYLGEARGDTPGVSQFLVARGGRREEWGFMKDGGLSWDLLCKGGVNWTIGKSQDNPSKNILPRSALIRYLGATYTEHGYDSSYDPTVLNDMDGNPIDTVHQAAYKRVVRVAGKAREEISGDYELDIGGNLVEQIGSSRSVNISGSYDESAIGDRTISTSGSFALNAITEIKVLTAQRTEKIVKGSDKKTILLGDDATEIIVGSQTLQIGAGNASRSVLLGDIKDTVVTGSKKTSVVTGSYEVSVVAGNVSLTTLAGKATLGGTMVALEGLVAVDIKAPIVGIGDPATRSGVITFLSHKDYVTGAPLVPSLKVMAGM